MTAQIFIVEDHLALRTSYILLLQREPDLYVCGTAATAEDALRLIPQQQPDLVLVDLSLPGMHSLTLIAYLYQIQPTLPVLIVSSHQPILLECIYNVKGYVHKALAPIELVPAIRRVLET